MVGAERSSGTRGPGLLIAMLVLAACTPAPSPSGAPVSPSPSATGPLVLCGPLADDPATCWDVIVAAGSSDAAPRAITVSGGSAHPWCAPPDPCISPPPDSYWVTFETVGRSTSVPVYLGADGWTAGLPPADPMATGCNLEPSDALVELPTDAGRCRVATFRPPVSFEAATGWLWAGTGTEWVLTRDNGYFTRLWVHRYGGSVVPHYCTDPPELVPMAAAADVVSWLGTVEGLQVEVTGRSVGVNPAWQLELSADGVPACSPGKSGLASLWTVDGREAVNPESIGDGEQLRIYLIELADGIVILSASWRELGDTGEFLMAAEAVFSSLSFEE